MPYCMYLRKSRADLEAEARGEGETLARHLQTLTLLAARLSLDVPPDAIYREIVSGDTIAARPMMQRLLQEVQDGKWQGVLCTEVERLARGDTIDQGIVANAFKYSNTKIITPAKVYDPNNEMDEEFFEFSLFMARREYKAIKRRMQAGRAASVREGHYVGGKRPYGYEVVKCQGSKGYTLKQIPEEAKIVRLVYDMYLYQGHGTASIATHLNSLGSTTYNGHPWDAGSVRKMLEQPVYAGFVQWLKRESKKTVTPEGYTVNRPLSDRYILARGLHDPIVSEEEYNRVREVAATRRTIAQVQNKHIASPLAGLARCACCGYALTRRPNRDDVFLVCRKPFCHNSSVRMDTAVSAVLGALRQWVEQYSDKGSPLGTPSSKSLPLGGGAERSEAERVNEGRDLELSAAQDALTTAQRQLTTAQEMLERGVYSVDEYINRRHALQSKIDAATEAIKEIKSRPAPADPAADIIRNLPQIRRVLVEFPHASGAPEQNALLRSVLRSVDPTDFLEVFLHPLHTPEDE